MRIILLSEPHKPTLTDADITMVATISDRNCASDLSWALNAQMPQARPNGGHWLGD